MPEIPSNLIGDPVALLESGWAWAQTHMQAASGVVAVVVGLGAATWVVGVFRDVMARMRGEAPEPEPQVVIVRKADDDD